MVPEPQNERENDMSNEIKMTADQILARFNDVDIYETHLCDLADDEFTFGGRVDEIVRECGYDESGKVCINSQSAWGMTINEWVHIMGL